jgi:hypothetical protein
MQKTRFTQEQIAYALRQAQDRRQGGFARNDTLKCFLQSILYPSTWFGFAHHRQAPYFALNDRVSDFAKASSFANATEDRTPDKSQGRPFDALRLLRVKRRRTWRWW